MRFTVCDVSSAEVSKKDISQYLTHDRTVFRARLCLMGCYFARTRLQLHIQSENNNSRNNISVLQLIIIVFHRQWKLLHRVRSGIGVTSTGIATRDDQLVIYAADAAFPRSTSHFFIYLVRRRPYSFSGRDNESWSSKFVERFQRIPSFLRCEL